MKQNRDTREGLEEYHQLCAEERELQEYAEDSNHRDALDWKLLQLLLTTLQGLDEMIPIRLALERQRDGVERRARRRG